MLRFRVCLLCIIYEGKRKKKHNRNRNARHKPPSLLRKCRPIHSLLRPHPFQRKEKEGKEKRQRGKRNGESDFPKKTPGGSPPTWDHRKEKREMYWGGAHHSPLSYHPGQGTTERKTGNTKRRARFAGKRPPVVSPNALNPKP